MDEKRTNRQQPRRKPPKRRRRRLGVVGALFYVAFIIGVSTFLATYGWTLANDVLALNKVDHSAVITLPEDIFTVYEKEEEVRIPVKTDGEEEELGTEEKDRGPIWEVLSTLLSMGDDGEYIVEKQTVTVQEADMDYVVQRLKEGGIIENEWLFKLFCAFTKGNFKLRPGTYTLNTDMDYLAIVTNLGSSSTSRATVTLTFTEGSSVDQIFEQLEKKGVATVEDLQDMAANHPYKFSFLQEIPLGDYHRLEGYLFPDTYEFYVGDDPKYVINKLLLNFDARFTDKMREQVAESEYSIYEILTIASLIEKETDGTDEKIIASVIYNRLNSRETAGKLQIDATLAYINGGRKPVEADKEIDSPYNTYLYEGLPAGPITNPGMTAIRAAMNPDKTNYYYYVLNPNSNRHEYSTNYRDHVNLVNKYAADK